MLTDDDMLGRVDFVFQEFARISMNGRCTSMHIHEVFSVYDPWMILESMKINGVGADIMGHPWASLDKPPHPPRPFQMQMRPDIFDSSCSRWSPSDPPNCK